MADVNPTVSIIILNVNGLNSSTKGRGCQTGFKKQEVQLYIVCKSCKDTNKLKIKRWKRYIMQTATIRKLTILISEKDGLKNYWCKEEHFIL